MKSQKEYIKIILISIGFAFMSTIFFSGLYFLLSEDSLIESLYSWGLILIGSVGIILSIRFAINSGLWKFSEYYKDSGFFGLPKIYIITALNVILLIVWASVLFFDIHLIFNTDEVYSMFIATGITFIAIIIVGIIQVKSQLKK